MGPFNSVAVYAPLWRGDRNAVPDVATRTTGVDVYYWTLWEFVTEELLPMSSSSPRTATTTQSPSPRQPRTRPAS